MPRLIVHAGFHKTGTSSVQAFLRANRNVLSRHARIYMRPDLEPLCDASRSYSLKPNAAKLGNVAIAAEAFFDTLDNTDPRPILISTEDLSGYMPGRLGIQTYAAAATIAAHTGAAAYSTFGDNLDLTFFYSTRAPAPWLSSSYWQNLRASRLTDTAHAYATQFANAADFDAILADIAETVAPASVTTAALETTSSTPQGPATPLLDLLDISPDIHQTLIKPPSANVQSDLGLDDILLAINRSGLTNDQVSDLKKHILTTTRNDPKGQTNG